MIRSYLYSLTLLLLLYSARADAQNTALVSGNWETGSNWSTGAAPVATDNVVIPAGITMIVTATGDVCGSLDIIASGAVTINANQSLAIGGNFTNAGTFTATAGSTLTFNGAANSVISGGGTYTIAATVVMDMGAPSTALDVQDANFITGINSGAKYYFTFTQGTFKMDNAGTLKDAYNSGSATALTIPYGVTIESDNGIMTLGGHATTNNMILSGKLFINGGIVQVQAYQAINGGQDFRYTVNGGTPQLYVTSGKLVVGAGFNALNNTDYIDFNMTGGTIILAEDGYSDWITFQLADNVGGKTFMSNGTIILQDACNAAIEDLDMGGANVAATLYSVTGGTVQLGYAATQAGATYFGINAEPATNYPNIDFQSGVAKTVEAWKGGQINMLSLYINSNMTYDASGFTTTNITGTNGIFAFDDEGTFKQSTNTMEFSGSTAQLITSSTVPNVTFYNLKIANTSGNVQLGVASTVQNLLSFTSGLLDASKKTLTLNNAAVAVTGASSSSYVIVGNGIAPGLGYLICNSLPTNKATLLPIGTASYYLPAYLNPGANAGTSFSSYVYTGVTQNGKVNGTPMTSALLANMLNAVWNISQTAGAGSATLTLDWSTAADVLEGSTFATAGTNIGITQYFSAGGWGTVTGSGSVAGMTATSTASSFSQFAIADNFVVLPVVISDFNATLNSNNSVSLTWQASDDQAISHFDVQRSADGVNFTTIGTVQAFAAESDYSLVDPNPASGVNYYRLLIDNSDGSNGFSVIKTVDLALGGGIHIYPIPATTTLNVSIGNAGPGIAVRLISQSGQVLQSASATGGSQVISMDISSYPAGAYFVQVIGQNTVLQTTTVVKL